MQRGTTGRGGAFKCLAVLAALAMFVAGCGDDDDEGATESTDSEEVEQTTSPPDDEDGGSTEDDVLQAAQDAVEAAREQPSTFEPPEVDPGAVEEGTQVAAISAINAAPLPFLGASELVRVAELIGWSGQVIDGQGSPANWDSAVRTALTGNADAIGFSAVQPSLIPEAAAVAADEGVPMAVFAGCEPGTPDGVVLSTPETRYDEGYLLGQWVIQDSPEGAEILLLDNQQFTCLQQAAQGFRDAIEEAGSTFQIVEEADSPNTDQSGPTGLQRLTAMLRENESAKYFFLMQEDWTPVFQEALRGLGRDDVVGLAMDWKMTVPMIRDQGNIVSAGRDIPYQAWTMLYGLVAGMNGIEVEPHNAPIYLIDSTNVDDVDGDLPTYGYDIDDAWSEYLTSSG